jgi:hypothetical protein
MVLISKTKGSRNMATTGKGKKSITLNVTAAEDAAFAKRAKQQNRPKSRQIIIDAQAVARRSRK